MKVQRDWNKTTFHATKTICRNLTMRLPNKYMLLNTIYSAKTINIVYACQYLSLVEHREDNVCFFFVSIFLLIRLQLRKSEECEKDGESDTHTHIKTKTAHEKWQSSATWLDFQSQLWIGCMQPCEQNSCQIGYFSRLELFAYRTQVFDISNNESSAILADFICLFICFFSCMFIFTHTHSVHMCA